MVGGTNGRLVIKSVRNKSYYVEAHGNIESNKRWITGFGTPCARPDISVASNSTLHPTEIGETPRSQLYGEK